MSTPSPAGAEPAWPPLPFGEWSGTWDTVLLWTQVVGKIRLALEPMINHWWQVPLYVTARGLTTSLMHAGDRGIEIEFDFSEQLLRLETTDGDVRRFGLEPRSVASFYDETTRALDSVGLRIPILARPVELPDAIPFAADDEHADYDPVAVQRWWRAMVQAHRVLTEFRAAFIGKASPVHYFWGAGDLATSRFSGRRAPRHPGGVPNCADWVQELAYSHEVSSCGFWPGGGAEGFFYSYTYPEPAGFAGWAVAPAEARYDETLGEFVLPYEVVRRAEDPGAVLLAFLQSSYEAGAELAGWDRAALEAGPGFETNEGGRR